MAPVPFIHQNRFVDWFGEDMRIHATYADKLRAINRALHEGLLDGYDGSRDVLVYAAHIHVSGAVLGGSERRVHITEEYATGVESIPAVSYAALGHIHKPQDVTGAVTAAYVGSPLALDFGERDEEKSIVLVDCEPGRPAVVSRLPLRGGRALRLVTGSLDEVLAADVGDAIVKVVVDTVDPIEGLVELVRERMAEATIVEIVENVASRRLEPAHLSGGEERERTLDELFDDFLAEVGTKSVPAAEVKALWTALTAERSVDRVRRADDLRAPGAGMRPLELRLSGFRSYRAERTVSFREMDLVAIIGDTGAGKSSLLEAMTWALYGASTWSRKTSTDLLAHNARRMTVTLEFEAAGERWLVTRSFGRSGGGTAELRCESDPAGHAKIDGVRLVDPEIERLIGLPYDVFCSCVLLPQGKFERLLKATKGEKTDTLKSILRLEQLGELRDRADGLARRVADREIKLLEARGRFLPDPVGDAAAAGDRLAVLRPQLDGLVKAQEEVRRLAEAGRGLADQARAADDEAVRLAARRGSASVELTRLAEAGAALERERAGAVEARDRAADEREAAEAAHAEAVAAGLDVPSLTSAAGTLRAARGTREREVELAQRIAADEQRHTELEMLVGTARDALAAAETTLKTHEERRTAEAASASALSERARTLATHAERVLAAVVTRDGSEAAVAPAREAAQTATAGLESARTELEAATAAAEAATTHRDDVQRTNAAAHLAGACAPGDPCPICTRDLPADFTAPEATDLAAATTALEAAATRRAQAEAAERTAALATERATTALEATERSLHEAEATLAAALAAAALAVHVATTAPRAAADSAAATTAHAAADPAAAARPSFAAVAVTPDDVSSAAERAAVEAAAATRCRTCAG